MEFQFGMRTNDWASFVQFWFAVSLGLYMQFVPVASCPKECRCDKSFIYCNERSLTSVPLGIGEGYKTLYLHNNQINNAGFPTELHNVASVEMVFLYGNQLDEFPLNLPRNVRSLHLQENNIQTISRSALAQLPMLVELHLDDNSISTVGVEEGAFQQASNLELLFLTKNHLSSVPMGLPGDLRELRLDENRIAEIDQQAFQNVTKLYRLLLDGNLLDDGAIAPGTFQNMENLRELSLSRNSLTEPPQFLPSKSLIKLNLQENQMQNLPVSAFVGLGKLEKLDLSSNLLQTLPQGVFDGLNSLKLVNARNNPWRCDCSMQWLVFWLKSLPSSVNIRGFICQRPDQLKGTVMRDLSADVLQCSEDSLSTTRFPLTPSPSVPRRTTALPRTTSITSVPSTPLYPATTRPTPQPHVPHFPPVHYPPYEDPLKMSVLVVNSTCVNVTWESYFTVASYKVTWVKRSQSLMMDVSQERIVSGEQRSLRLYDLEPRTVYRICVYILDALNSFRPGEDTICSEIRTKSAPRSPGNSSESEQAAQQDVRWTFLLAGVIGGVVVIILVTLLGLFCWHTHKKSKLSCSSSTSSSSKWKYNRGRRKDDDYCEAGTKKDNSILEMTETSFQIVPLNNEQLLKGDFRIQPIYTPNVGIGYRDCHLGNNSMVYCKSSNVPGVEFCHT